MLAVVANERSGLVFVDRQAVSDCFFIIVRALIKLGSVVIANTFGLRRDIDHVVDRTAGFADAAAGKAPNEHIVGDAHVDHFQQCAADFREQLIEQLGLLQRTRESVEHETGIAGGLRNPFLDDAEDHRIGHQFAFFHEDLCSGANGASGLDRRTEHIAR